MRNDIQVVAETFQIIGDDTLRLDISVTGTVEQDGKSISFNHERVTVYVRKSKGFRFEKAGDISVKIRRSDQRQKGAI
jgi:hypothetical protein